MNVYLVRSKELSLDKFTEILEFLQSFDGPVDFLEAGPLPGYRDKSNSTEQAVRSKFLKQKAGDVTDFLSPGRFSSQ